MVFALPQYTLAFSFDREDMRELTCTEDEAITVGRVLLRAGAEVHMRPYKLDQWTGDKPENSLARTESS